MQKDKVRRKMVQKYEGKRIARKAVQNGNNTAQNKFKALRLLSLKVNSSPIRIQNRCVLTGRSRGIFQFSKLSRIMIRQLADKGLLSGLKKNTW